MPGSTSRPATATDPTLPAASRPSAWTDATRCRVRRAATQTFLAVRTPLATPVTLMDGATVLAAAGDWLVQQGRDTVAVIPAGRFPGDYEVVADGALTLTAFDRERLEQTTGLGTTRSGVDLALAVERLARIQIGDLVVPFTPGQLEEIAHNAQKRGQSVMEYLRAIVTRIEAELFHGGR